MQELLAQKRPVDYATDLTMMDLSKLAHRAFWAISKNNVNANKDSAILDVIDYDDATIAIRIEQILLNIGANVLEAHALHQELFRETPKRFTNAPHLLGKVF